MPEFTPIHEAASIGYKLCHHLTMLDEISNDVLGKASMRSFDVSDRISQIKHHAEAASELWSQLDQLYIKSEEDL